MIPQLVGAVRIRQAGRVRWESRELRAVWWSRVVGSTGSLPQPEREVRRTGRKFLGLTRDPPASATHLTAPHPNSGSAHPQSDSALYTPVRPCPTGFDLLDVQV